MSLKGEGKVDTDTWKEDDVKLEAGIGGVQP